MGSQGLEPRDAKALEALALPPLVSEFAKHIISTGSDESGAASDLPQYFRAMRTQGGAEFRASTAQRMATLADAGRQGEHAAAAAWLARRCELLWSRGYFSKSRESDKNDEPRGVVVLSTLAADYLCSRLAEGALPTEALQELLCALLALRHAAGVAGHGPVAALRSTAAHAAAYATAAWLKLYGADDPPPAVWEEGGVLEVWRLQIVSLAVDVKPDTPELYALAHVYLAQAATFLEAFLGGQHKQAQQAAWRWLLPACMQAGIVAGMHPACEEPPAALRTVWLDLAAALKPLTTVLTETRLASGVGKAELTKLLGHVDDIECFHGLAVLLHQLVSVCARLPPRSAQHVRQFEEISFRPPTWWEPVNDALAGVLALAAALVGKRELPVEAFLECGGLAAVHQYLEFWGPQAHKLYTDHPHIHYHAGQLLDLVSLCMVSYKGGPDAQCMFFQEGLPLCIAALDNMLEPDLLVCDIGPDRWGACKSVLRALESACYSPHNIMAANCLLFLEEGGIDAVIPAVVPRRPPPSESSARQNSQWRNTSLMRNGISLLACLVDAHYAAPEHGKAHLGREYLGRVVAMLEDAFAQQDCTLAFGLVRLVQWGIVAHLGEISAPDKLGAQAPSRHSLLSAALTLLCACVECDAGVRESIVSNQGSLATLQRAGQQYLTRGAVHVMGASRPWLRALEVLARHAPEYQDELLSKGLFRTAGGVIATTASYLGLTYQAANEDCLEDLISSEIPIDAMDAFQQLRPTLLAAQNRAVEAGAALLHTLSEQAMPASARCCEALLAAAGPAVQLDAEGIPESLQLVQLVQRVREAEGMVARQRRVESATLERKAQEAEAAFAALLAEEEEAEKQKAASQAKKAAKRQKQKERAAAEREAAAREAAAAAAEAAEAEAARQAQQQWQREEAQQQAEGQQAPGEEAGSSKKKKKKKKKGGQAGEPAGPGAEQQEPAAGSSQQPPPPQQQQQGPPPPQQQQEAAGLTPQVLLLDPGARAPEVQGLGAAAAAAGGQAEEPEELQDLLAHLLPSMYPSSAASSAVATPDVPLGGVPPPPPPPPPQWLQPAPQHEQQQEQQQAPPPAPAPQREWERFPAQLRAVLSCPLTGGMLADPVILSDGHSYERQAAEAWLASNDCSPLTGEALDTSVCRPNHALRQLIEEFA